MKIYSLLTRFLWHEVKRRWMLFAIPLFCMTASLFNVFRETVEPYGHNIHDYSLMIYYNLFAMMGLLSLCLLFFSSFKKHYIQTRLFSKKEMLRIYSTCLLMLAVLSIILYLPGHLYYYSITGMGVGIDWYNASMLVYNLLFTLMLFLLFRNYYALIVLLVIEFLQFIIQVNIDVKMDFPLIWHADEQSWLKLVVYALTILAVTWVFFLRKRILLKQKNTTTRNKPLDEIINV